MKKFFATVLAVMSLLTATVVYAEVKTYEGVGEYYMSDFETPNVAQQRAKQRAEQNACEQAGVFVKSVSRSINSRIVEDEIIAMTSGILKVVDVQYHRENFDNNTTLIRATIKAQIDSDDVLKWLNKDSQERATLEQQYAEIRKAYAEQEKQIAELKRQLANVKTPQDEERITQQFAAEDKIFLANQKVDEGWKLWGEKDFAGAAKLFDEAVQLNSNNAEAYFGRGTAYGYLGQNERAIQDFDKAIELNTNFDVAYYNRGLAYDYLKQYKRAIADYDKAIGLNPNYAEAYNNRGLAYDYLKQYKRAIADFDKAIALKPNFALAYYIRGNAYTNLRQYERAIADATKAIQINPKFAEAYHLRGLCYQAIGDETKAQSDFAKAKELDYNG